MLETCDSFTCKLDEFPPLDVAGSLFTPVLGVALLEESCSSSVWLLSFCCPESVVIGIFVVVILISLSLPLLIT